MNANLSEWALKNQPLVRYLIVVLLIAGLGAFFELGQDEDPPFTFRAMVVRAFWPGASAEQMAEQVADKIEKKLQESPYADRIRTYTKPGEMLTVLELKGESPPREVGNVWYTVRKNIGDIRGTLPTGVVGPFFNDDFGDVYGVLFAFTSDGFSYAELKDHVERVRQDLLRVRDVAKIELFGVQDEKVYIDVSHRRLAQMGLDINNVIASINAQNDVSAAGVLTTDADNVQVRVTGQFDRVEDLAKLPIRTGSPANPVTLRLGDVAAVSRAYVDPPTFKIRENGSEVIVLGVSMAKGGDIIRLGRNLAAAEQRILASLPVGITMQKIQDQPRAVASSVNEFIKVLIEALVIVLAVSFVTLGLHKRSGGIGFVIDVRPGLVVALTIPLVLAMTMLVMYLTNTNLHKISLGALIIALGLLVDDAIIAVEMMVRKMEEGLDRFDAAIFAFKVTAMPMLTGTLITAVGFMPIAIAKSVAGEYTFTIFSVTTMALLLSWIAAVIFTPYIGFMLLRRPAQVGHDAAAQHGSHGVAHDAYDTPTYRRLRGVIEWCVRHRWTTIAATLLAFAGGLAGMATVEQQFFPDSSRLELLVDLWTPEGSSFGNTEREAIAVEKWVRAQPEVDSVTTYVGSGAPRFYLPMDQIFPQTNVAQMVISTRDLHQRDALRLRLLALFDKDFPGVRGRVKLLPNGPPVPYPVQFRIAGPDITTVRRIADEVKTIVAANPNTRSVNDNWNESIRAVRLQIDQDKARALGVTSRSLAQATAVLTAGAPIGQFRDGDRLIDIVLRNAPDERATIEAASQVNVPIGNGRSVPLSQIARPVLTFEPGVIWRENRDYAVTVNADVVDGIQGPTVTFQIDPKLAELRAKLPPGFAIVVAGAQEESSKGQDSIVAGMPLMLFVTFTLLMLQLKSFSRSLLVFLTGPFGLIGAALALHVLHRPFGFVALLGLIALIGMIQRNSVILIDQIEQDIADGHPVWTAIVDATVRRARPIVLTAAAAILAMIPLSRSVFWGPMAVAIMGGLIVATLLTLLSLPAMYAAWFRVREPRGPASE
ncbi:MAG: efflux RND transporter permease subunit [Burkholderiaceae bacterium]